MKRRANLLFEGVLKKRLTDTSHDPLVGDGGHEVRVGLGAGVIFRLHHAVRVLVKRRGQRSGVRGQGLTAHITVRFIQASGSACWTGSDPKSDTGISCGSQQVDVLIQLVDIIIDNPVIFNNNNRGVVLSPPSWHSWWPSPFQWPAPHQWGSLHTEHVNTR